MRFEETELEDTPSVRAAFTFLQEFYESSGDVVEKTNKGDRLIEAEYFWPEVIRLASYLQNQSDAQDSDLVAIALLSVVVRDDYALKSLNLLREEPEYQAIPESALTLIAELISAYSSPSMEMLPELSIDCKRLVFGEILLNLADVNEELKRKALYKNMPGLSSEQDMSMRRGAAISQVFNKEQGAPLPAHQQSVIENCRVLKKMFGDFDKPLLLESERLERQYKMFYEDAEVWMNYTGQPNAAFNMH